MKKETIDQHDKKLDTKYQISWCPGCPNFRILEAAKLAITSLINQGYKQTDFAMATGIGCHGKIFDYLNISGFYGLHGRAIPTAIGLKLGNPNLNIIAFAGDGDTYSEGLQHFISAGKHNADIALFVHDNQSFSLTTGQPTPTSEKGFKNKIDIHGEKPTNPINPLMLALSSGITFIARANARDPQQTAKIMEQAIKHKGFAFVEIIQDCVVFNVPINNRDKNMYYLDKTPTTKEEAIKLIQEYDYNIGDGKIALGVFWQEQRPTLEDQFPQLQNIIKNKVQGWKGLKR
ncbi:MAG: 2-oxoacid:ferredoxin oxidoreductase subunit beta [Nanoarchaeota archaeon]|nr:2-oxoacid:ferredoxin oxidoreductase subunit beta [Nanoarchaeota archaeon]MBU0977278.1 2-oxoacid:ferredoxin oxidoreductase subunit beta [Nanoarchaeota archaeon]